MKKFLSLVLALVMTMSLVTISAGAEDFTDDASITYEEAVDVMSAIGVVGGYADGSFNPTAGLSRGAAAKIICNMILGPTTAEALNADAAPYSDVAVDNTYAGYIAYCAKEGIISGYADGTFRPYAPLTGYAFMKMLLGALGYDAEVEGYTGANWSISVAKRALNLGLDDGLDGEFTGAKALNREEACLYAFNALCTEMVKYPNSSSIVVGNVTVTTSSTATGTGDLFREVYFAKLRGYTVTDTYGRPATKWTWKNDEIGTYADAADVVYTSNAKQYTVKVDLGLNTTDNHDFYYTTNTTSGQTTGYAGTMLLRTSADDQKLNDYVAGIAGNGITVEIFYDPDVADYNKIVSINEYIDQVDEVDEDDDGRYIEVNGLKYHTEDFEEDQWVLYTVGDEYATKMASVKAAEMQTGTVTKIDNTNSKYTIDGTVYSLHAGYSNGTIVVGDEVEYYLDSAGYIIKMELSSLSAALENLVMVYDKTDDDTSSWTTLGKVVYGTGETGIVTLKDAATAYDTVYNYTTSSGKLKVESNAYYTSTPDYTVGAHSKGDITVEGVKVNSKTTFIYLDTSDDSTKVYTGYNNAPDYTGATSVVTYKKNTANAALLVIVVDPTGVSNTASDLTYVIADSDDVLYTEKNADGDRYSYYEVKTLTNETLKVDSATWTAIKAYEVNGVALIDTMSIDENDVITATPLSDLEGSRRYITAVANAVIEVEDGVLYSTTKRDRPIADDAVVYTVAKDGESFVKGDISDIVDNAGKYQGYTLVCADDDGVITTLVLKKA